MNTLTFALMLAGLAALSFGTRASFILLGRNVRLPPAAQRALRFVPPAVFFSLLVPELLFVGGGLNLTPGNAKLLAGIAAGLVAWRTRSTLATIVAGMAVLHLVGRV